MKLKPGMKLFIPKSKELENMQDKSNYFTATLTCFITLGGNIYFITANHIWDHTNSNKIYVENDDQKLIWIAKKQKSYDEFAICFVYMNYEKFIDPFFENYGDHVYINNFFGKQGAETGGGVVKVYNILNSIIYCKPAYNGQEITVKGDSGCPYYSFKDIYGMGIMGNNEDLFPDDEWSAFIPISEFFKDNPDYKLLTVDDVNKEDEKIILCHDGEDDIKTIKIQGEKIMDEAKTMEAAPTMDELANKFKVCPLGVDEVCFNLTIEGKDTNVAKVLAMLGMVDTGKFKELQMGGNR